MDDDVSNIDDFVNPPSCPSCVRLQAHVQSLQAEGLELGEVAAAAIEYTKKLESDLATARIEAVQDYRIRAQNERLLDVIYALKKELDRQPVPEEILGELLEAKSSVALLRAERDELSRKIADAKDISKKRRSR
jgi:hypothetical protein